MTELHAALAARVDAWRADGYPHEGFPTIAEVLHFAIEGEDPDVPYPASGAPRHLRAAQFRALETYWYLRLVEGTPRIADLYLTVFPNTSDRPYNFDSTPEADFYEPPRSRRSWAVDSTEWCHASYVPPEFISR